MTLNGNLFTGRVPKTSLTASRDSEKKHNLQGPLIHSSSKLKTNHILYTGRVTLSKYEF